MMTAAAHGRLGQEPRSIETKSGNAMAVASIAVSVGEHGEDPLWVGILAFGRLAEDLLRHQKGDMLSVSGRVQRNAYKTSSGEKREQLQIVADSIVSARSVRPSGGKRKDDDRSSDAPRNARGGRDFNDDLPF